MDNPLRTSRAFLPAINALEPRIALSAIPPMGPVVVPVPAEGAPLPVPSHHSVSDKAVGGAIGGGSMLELGALQGADPHSGVSPEVAGTTGSSSSTLYGTRTYTGGVTTSAGVTSPISSPGLPTNTTATTNAANDRGSLAAAGGGSALGGTAIGGGATLPLATPVNTNLPSPSIPLPKVGPISPSQSSNGSSAFLVQPADRPTPPSVREPLAQVQADALNYATYALQAMSSGWYDYYWIQYYRAEQKQAGGPGKNPEADSQLKVFQNAYENARTSYNYFNAGFKENYNFLATVKFKNTPAGQNHAALAKQTAADLYNFWDKNSADIFSHKNDYGFQYAYQKKGPRYPYGDVGEGPTWPWTGN